MEKIEVKICVGTTCFIMGAAELQDIEKYIPVEMANRIEVSGTSCLGICKQDNYGNAPFVMVNDEVISNATIKCIINKIKEKLEVVKKNEQDSE